ncbi:NAD(P)-dependent oxidoreductase [Roseiterribacter gracilis]|uniref:dihydrouracil dehydrogenase (NAD(+)) n=1 Tax=Roseiterribacter gracilis TaxID=2812848 RepID=A0A8S8X7M6_9PROT|nr:dihydropyrimidine dehydrogenase subunit A [Rhodospirillales bacterium TMPK1]
MADLPDIAAHRLSADALRANFGDAEPPLTDAQAVVEANRCYFCYDAPCIQACPTGIDIPGFIRGIATGNVKGAALRILEENIMGGTCARACPTEILCEQACVRNAQEAKPIDIGGLQRHATDHLFDAQIQPFTRAAPTGKRVAVVGAGPAGLACAHALSRQGHEIVVYEARAKAGGLNEYGLAAYKMADEFAAREVAFILAIGGITIENNRALGRDLQLGELTTQFDAVFLGMGQAGVNALNDDAHPMDGFLPAVDFIAALRQADDKSTVPVGRRVVVIGGGNTAIDAAVQSKRLGAEDVTLVYRRGADDMSATTAEQEWAQTNDVRIKRWARPARLHATDGAVRSVEFERTKMGADGKLTGTGEFFTVDADMVLTAIGQTFVPDPVTRDANAVLELDRGRIRVDADHKTSLPNVFAGGDCVQGQDLTVSAVQHGKLAARAIDRLLRS